MSAVSEVVRLVGRSSDTGRTTEGAQTGVAEFLPGYSDTPAGARVFYGGLAPRQVPKAWVQGLSDAGFKAKAAQVHLGGGKYKTLSLVVQFDCPFDHVDETGEGWAKVRLKVNPYTGWVSIHQDSCPRCTQQQIEAWLITCPRCAAGEGLGEHPDHDAECYGFYLPDGDESPVAYVMEAMHQFGRGQALVADTSKARGEWTVEKAREWLDALVNEDGSHLVPVGASQRETWRLVQGIPGHPAQRFVHKAQALRGI